MEEKKFVEKVIDKCKIYHDSNLISEEKILKKYLTFFATQFDKEEKRVSFSFHTGSLCFDIMAILAISLGCITYNMTNNEDILDTLEIGDMVICKGSRYRWKGIQEIEQKKSLVLERDGKGKDGLETKYLPYDTNKHLIKPYYGNSKNTDSRGIKKKQYDREDFLAWLFNVPISEIPSELDISVVIVANRERFTEIVRNVRVVYDKGKEIGLLDIVSASYYTSNGKEHIIGKNQTKSEAILKVTEKISEARRLVLDKHGNKVIGFLAVGMDAIVRDSSELSDLLRRKNLKFVHVMGPLRSEISEKILELYEEAEVFACTKEYLKKNSSSIQNRNVLTHELNVQVCNIIKSNINIIQVNEKGWSWEQYSTIKKGIFKVKQSDWDDKDEFVLSSYALLNLLNTAVFSLETIEQALKEGRISTAVVSPRVRLNRLKELCNSSGSLQETCDLIMKCLEEKYEQLFKENSKELKLDEYLHSKLGKRIVIIVPKAYYVDILNSTYKHLRLWNNVSCTTVNRYDSNSIYDNILIIGNLNNRKFDPLRWSTSNSIDLLLYPCEEKVFNHTKKKITDLTRRLNKKQGITQVESASDIEEIVNDKWEEKDDMLQEFLDLDQYIDSMNLYNIREFVTSSIKKSNSLINAEVQIVGTFVTGERILFSKNYNPIVYNPDKRNVMEITPDKLKAGYILIFVKRDNYTKNVVDFIYEYLIEKNRLGVEVLRATDMVKYWKETLRNYKEDGKYTYQNLATQLNKYGSSLQTDTIRQWLIEDSHIVGPRTEKTMYQIALLTQDEKLLSDVHGYFEACRIVRHQRKEILDLIGKAIEDRLAGNQSQIGSVLSVVYDNVDNLSKMIELDNVAYLEETVNIPVNLVNRPITEMEVLP